MLKNKQINNPSRGDFTIRSTHTWPPSELQSKQAHARQNLNKHTSRFPALLNRNFTLRSLAPLFTLYTHLCHSSHSPLTCTILQPPLNRDSTPSVAQPRFASATQQTRKQNHNVRQPRRTAWRSSAQAAERNPPPHLRARLPTLQGRHPCPTWERMGRRK